MIQSILKAQRGRKMGLVPCNWLEGKDTFSEKLPGPGFFRPGGRGGQGGKGGLALGMCMCFFFFRSGVLPSLGEDPNKKVFCFFGWVCLQHHPPKTGPNQLAWCAHHCFHFRVGSPLTSQHRQTLATQFRLFCVHPILGFQVSILDSHFDHLESSNWNVSSFDLAVNLNLEDPKFYPSYADFIADHAPPELRLRSWQLGLV